MFDNVPRVLYFNQSNIEVDKLPSIAKKKQLRKKFKKHSMRSFQKTKQTQTTGSVLAERSHFVQRTNFGLYLTKTVDCS